MTYRRICLSLLLAVSSWSAFAQGLPRALRAQIIEAVVQIIPWDPEAGDLAPWSGSGTIISEDGYILTNFHVIGDTETREYYQDHAIYMTRANATDEAPVMRYWARYVASDPTHDLALLKIYQYPDESPIPTDLTFPSVAVGDSTDLLPGDTITIVGYPGISGSTITFTAGLMSGWVGEDFEAGGKQWIKTDAKIAHGNSGGGAFNEAGNLIGVPTAGRTLQYEELDIEEQAYVRPVGLAWALLGPNVPSVNRAVASQNAGAPATTTPTNTAPANTATTPTAPPSSSTPGGAEPSGEYGAVVLNSSVEGTIAFPTGEEPFVYHTYTVEIPAGTSSVTVRLSGDAADLDLALKAGAVISDYDDVDYIDTSDERNPSYTYANPPAGTLYIDVLNLLATPADYVLSVVSDPASTTGSSPANPLAPPTNPLNPGNAQTPANPLAPATPAAAGAVTANTTESATIGAIQPGQAATGRLSGVAEAVSYHTYFVEVPAGTQQLVISMSADADLDLAAKFGSEIASYLNQADGGDWTERDNSTSTGAEFVLENPQAGRWYIDVYNALGATVTGGYSLSIR